MANLTFQTGIHEHTSSNLTKYALFLGGLNVTRNALEQYDPLRTGFGRIFMIRKPIFLDNVPGMDKKLKKFKHILEYGNTGVSGNNNISMQFNQMQGGYTNRSMEIPNIATDDANELVIKTFEFSGSPVREVIQMWINGVSDLQSGYAHYYGMIGKSVGEGDNAATLTVSQANHTAEFIYVVTDPSGRKVEYAALFANCFPKEVKLDHFNYDAGNHELVPMDIAFTATRYMSPQINYKAAELIDKYNVLVNSLNFNSGFTGDNLSGKEYNASTGQLVDVADEQGWQDAINKAYKGDDSVSGTYKPKTITHTT